MDRQTVVNWLKHVDYRIRIHDESLFCEIHCFRTNWRSNERRQRNKRMSDAVRFQEANTFELLIEFFVHLIRIALGNCCRNVAESMIDWNLPHIFELTKEIASVAQRFVFLFPSLCCGSFFAQCVNRIECYYFHLFTFLVSKSHKIHQFHSNHVELEVMITLQQKSKKIIKSMAKITPRKIYIESNRIGIACGKHVFKNCIHQSNRVSITRVRKVIKRNLHFFFPRRFVFFHLWLLHIFGLVSLDYNFCAHVFRRFISFSSVISFHSFAQHTKDAEKQWKLID